METKWEEWQRHAVESSVVIYALALAGMVCFVFGVMTDAK